MLDTKILIVDDDTNICDLLKLYFENEGYAVKSANDGVEGLNFFKIYDPDIVLLDIMLPKKDGWQVCREIREISSKPIIMITAKDAFDDMRRGFLSGVDDYMVKPINVNEMTLRVGALLRRAQMINERRLTIGKTVLECDSLTVITESGSTVLPQKEFMMLYKMASYPGRIFTRQQMMDEIWGYDTESDTHTVDVHIGRLREKFRDSSDFKIVTMRGVGYKVVKL